MSDGSASHKNQKISEERNEMPAKSKDIFVVRCSILGDQNNLLGLAEALKNEFGGEIKLVDIRFRSRVLETLFLHLIQQKHESKIWDHVTSFFCVGDIPAKEEVDGAFVLSTLGAGELPAVYLSKLGAFSIHLGELKRIPYNLIDMTIAHPGHVTKVDEFKLPCAPSSIDEEKLLPKAKRNDLLVAFGGNTGSLTYSRYFYEKTLSLAAIAAERNRLTLKITTSHRTGLRNEEIIQEYIQDKSLKVEQLALYNQSDVPSMGFLLSNAAIALISAESVSMISEALAASAKTVAIYEHALPKEERISRFLEEQLCNNQIMLIDAISSDDIELASLQFPSVSWKTPFLSAVHRKLNKKNIRAAA